MLKKISALLLALAMVLSLASVAWAADDTYSGSGDPNATTKVTELGGDKIPLTKSIVFFNENGSTVYEPNISFVYTVTPDPNIAEGGTTPTVTDDASPAVTRNVYPGPDGGVTGTTIAFSTAKSSTAAAEGTEVEESGELGVDLSKFERPGIYRYLITETPVASGTTTPAIEVTDAGLTERDEKYDDTRYLDVYIHYNNEGEREMYGAVIFRTTKTTSGEEGTDSITTSTEKTTGFEPVSGGEGYSYADDPYVDKYTTYDFTVKKVVAGSMGDKNHEFPFYITITNTITGAKYTYIDDPGTGEGTAETIADATITKGTSSSSSPLKLKDGEFVKFVGVPSSQTTALTLDVTEYNDTYDEYVPTVAATKGTPTLKKTGAMDATTGSASINPFNIKTNDANGQIITVTNTLDEISPTGVVMRVAPYALILAAGMALLLISRRRKAVVEE